MAKKQEERDELEDLFTEENIPESNWFKFTKVGDRVSGEVVSISEKPAKDAFPAQRVFTLKQKDGEMINVGISMNKDYLIARTNSVKLGDILGFEFKKEVPSSLGKGYANAKSIEAYVKHVDHSTDSAE